MGSSFAVLRLAAIRAALALAPACFEWNAATDGVAAAARRAQFAADIWRKAPLVIRGALDAEALDRACDVDLLAGLALEDDVVSRLVTAPAFAVEVGPFGAARLEALPDRGWTLLLNDAELHAALQGLGDTFGDLSSEDVDACIEDFELDGDGVVSYDEFLAFARRGCEQLAAAGWAPPTVASGRLSGALPGSRNFSSGGGAHGSSAALRRWPCLASARAYACAASTAVAKVPSDAVPMRATNTLV